MLHRPQLCHRGIHVAVNLCVMAGPVGRRRLVGGVEGHGRVPPSTGRKGDFEMSGAFRACANAVFMETRGSHVENADATIRKRRIGRKALRNASCKPHPGSACDRP